MHSINVIGRESNPLKSYATVTAIEKNTQENREKHNQEVLDILEPGDLLEFERGVYSHWAVYIGNGDVVHLSGVDGAGGSDLKHPCTISGVKSDKGIVCKEDLWKVAGDSKAYKNNPKEEKLKSLEPSKIVERALSKVGEVGYNLLYENCEHFAMWCRYGIKKSYQAGLFAAVASVVVGFVVLVVSLAIAALFLRG
ncbi:phospholipase A and acyltransferase 3-like [Haliotis rubra]|uniref:phospholipase A and acyltransferase 3-like n=1 Tax=Haliotis rubra TaxID=36100 RepID=UPI001EE51A4C|nr:phospholipase A and acyltransferase 3-like [Haliotis rubra]